MNLLNAPHATVLREGMQRQILSEELVKDDIVVLRAGDQICADATVLEGNVQVNEWAKAFFNGGGHLNAAGGQMDLPLAEVVRKVKETIPWFFEQLKNSGI